MIVRPKLNVIIPLYNAEKYIEKTKLILEIHSRGLREKDFSLSQLHELQNYLERTEK